MGSVAGKLEKGFFQGTGVRLRFQAGRGVASEHDSTIEYDHAVGEKLDLLEGVRSEEQGGVPEFEHVVLEKVAKVGSRDSVQTPRGLVEKQHARLMQKGAGQAQALNCPRRECANLPVESFTNPKRFAQPADAARNLG